jgi:acetyl-CoA/propionyl-CoA carboxylase biotin carboxyl carrier protein
MPTVLPFHRAVLDDPAFCAPDGHFAVHTRWIETEFDNTVPPYDAPLADQAEAEERTTVVVEVNGKRLEVVLPASLAAGPAPATRSKRPPRRAGRSSAPAAASGNALTSPMQGTVVKVAVADGDLVEAGDLVVVLEAMKMEQPLTAHRSGTIDRLTAQVGATVTSGSTLCEIVD